MLSKDNLQKGDKVAFSLANGETLTGTYSHHAPNQKAYIKGDNGISYERVYSKIKKIGNAKTDFEVSGETASPNGMLITAPPNFRIRY